MVLVSKNLELNPITLASRVAPNFLHKTQKKNFCTYMHFFTIFHVATGIVRLLIPALLRHVLSFRPPQ
jgi:hypothetical protein